MNYSKVVPYFMFHGNAEEAIQKYFSIFGNGEIQFMQKYGDAQEHLNGAMAAAEANLVIHCSFVLNGQPYFCSDSQQKQGANPGGVVTLCVNCESDEEIERLYKEFSEIGTAVMPLQDTFWDARYAVVADKYGVTWQLNYHKNEVNK